MKYIDLNKKNNKIILFIHGLFSTPGFWLQYIDLFKDFRLIILNINYIKSTINEIQNDIAKILLINNLKGYDYIITHSMGSIILLNYDFNYNSINFDICPYYLSNISDEKYFIDKIVSINNKSFNEIEKQLIYLQDKFKNSLLQKI